MKLPTRCYGEAMDDYIKRLENSNLTEVQKSLLIYLRNRRREYLDAEKQAREPRESLILQGFAEISSTSGFTEGQIVATIVSSTNHTSKSIWNEVREYREHNGECGRYGDV